MKLEGAYPIEDKIPLNEIPVPPFPNNEEAQSKSVIVFSEMEEYQKPKDEEVQSKTAKVFSKMEEHQNSKDMNLEGADPIQDKIQLNEIEENAQDKVKLLQKDEIWKLHPLKNYKKKKENRKKNWVNVCAWSGRTVVGLAAMLAYRKWG